MRFTVLDFLRQSLGPFFIIAYIQGLLGMLQFSLFQKAQKFNLNAHHVHGAVSIPQEPPKKFQEF